MVRAPLVHHGYRTSLYGTLFACHVHGHAGAACRATARRIPDSASGGGEPPVDRQANCVDVATREVPSSRLRGNPTSSSHAVTIPLTTTRDVGRRGRRRRARRSSRRTIFRQPSRSASSTRKSANGRLRAPPLPSRWSRPPPRPQRRRRRTARRPRDWVTWTWTSSSAWASGTKTPTKEATRRRRRCG